MGYQYEQTECDDFLCKWQNYSRKVPHHPVPDFKLTTLQLSTQPSTATTSSTTTVETITSFIKDIITSNATNEEATTEAAITTVTENMGNVLNSTMTDNILQFQPELNETISSNSSMVFESTTSSSIISTLQNGSFPVETMQNTTMDNQGSVLTTVSEIASSTVANAISVVNATTEKAMQLITNAPSSVNEGHHHSDMPSYKNESHHLLYVILIIIIAILLLIGIILLLIYIRYRKTSLRALHTYYEVSPMNGNASSNNEQVEQKEVPTEVYMHYNC